MMNGDLRDLYQEVILDHNKHPRNYGRIERPDRTANGHNPLCGDKLRLYLKTRGGRIEEVTFEGEGCAISVASASLMTEAVQGKTVAEAEALFARFHEMLTGEAPPNGAEIEEIGNGQPHAEAELEDLPEFEKLQALSGVREFPVRVKCATLAWHTLHAALHGEHEISTE